MPRGRLRLPLVVVAALAAAEAGVLLLRPRSGLIEPVPVSARSYFSAAELQRARAFRRPQLVLYGAVLAVEAGVLVALVRRPPRWLPHRAALGGAAVSLVLTAAPLPLQAISRQRAVDVGLVTQSWGGWAADVAKGAAIGALFAGAGVGVAALLERRLGRRWWVPAAALVVLAGAGLTYAGPVVLDPLFNRFTPLEPGRLRGEILALARRAGVRVGEVYVVDASRRTTAANAYVTGLGATKRVVLYDTLLRYFTPAQTRLVVAHELGHVRERDVPHGLLYLALVAPLGMLAVARATEALGARDRRRRVPALLLCTGVAASAIGVVSNQLSRAVEARADAFALRLTDEPQAFVAFQRRIALANVADPDPPRAVHLLLGTHPSTVERIGIARAFEAARTR